MALLELVNGTVPLPRTLLSGVPKERRDEAAVAAAFAMPIDDLRTKLERMDDKLTTLVSAIAQQEILNQQSERNRSAIEGEDGILVRLRSLEDSRHWHDKLFWTFLPIGMAAIVDMAIRAWNWAH